VASKSLKNPQDIFMGKCGKLWENVGMIMDNYGMIREKHVGYC
jgi:hypothetical protein